MYGITDYQTILSRLGLQGQLEVWRDILNPGVSLYQLTTNPFRIDSHPNAYLREYNGVILLTDFAYPKYNKYTCIHAIADIYDCSLFTASIHANNIYFNHAYQLRSSKQTILSKVYAPSERTTTLHFTPFTFEGKATFTQRDKEYWQKRFVSSRQLINLNVYSVKNYYIGNSLYFPTHPAYAYYFPTTAHTKIYIPAQKQFFGNVTAEDVWKVSRNSNVCVITKSAKDLLVLENLIPDADIHSFQSEAVIPDIDAYLNYDKVFIFYDNDATGIAKSANLHNLLPNSTEIRLPQHCGKDPDECITTHGFNFAQDTVGRLIHNAYDSQAHAPILVGQTLLH